jgi:hypothetical protein
MRWIAIILCLLGATTSRADPPLVQLDTGGPYGPDQGAGVHAGTLGMPQWSRCVRLLPFPVGREKQQLAVRAIRGLSGTRKVGQLYALAIWEADCRHGEYPELSDRAALYEGA